MMNKDVYINQSNNHLLLNCGKVNNW